MTTDRLAALPAAGPVATTASRRDASVHTNLLLLVLGVLLPLLAFAGIAVWRFAGAERSRIEQAAQTTANGVAAALDRDFAALVATVQVLANSLALRDGDLEAFHRQAAAATAVLESVVALRDPASRQVMNTGIPWGQPLPATTGLAEADAAAARTGGPLVSDLYRGVRDRRLWYAIVLPVRLGEAPGHFLSLSMPAERVQRLLLQARLEPGEVAGVLDRAGVFVARTLDPEAIGQPARLRSPDNAEAGIRSGINREGVPALLAYQRSVLSDWGVGVTVPEAVLAAPLRRALLWLGAVGAAALALAVLAALLLGRRIGAAVQSLAAAGIALREDRPVPVLATPIREVNQAAAALAAAARDALAQQAARRLGEDRLRLALSHAPIRIHSWDAGLRTTWVGNPDRDDEVAPAGNAEAAEELMAFKRRVLETGQGARRTVRWQAADGQVAHFDLTAEPIRDAAGRVTGGVLAALDITAPARAAEERAVLLERLDAERARLAAVLEAAPVALIIAEAPSGRIIAGNRMNQAVFGHAVKESAEWRHYGEWAARHPDGTPVQPAEHPLSRVIHGLEERPEATMLHTGRPDGREVWIKAIAAPIRDAQQRITGAVVAVLDIDAERRAIEALSRQEALHRLLINELNHRVKNTLATVQSMAAMTLRHAGGLEDARRRLNARLLALAAAHDVLTRTSWEGAPLAEVLDVALAPHRSPQGPGQEPGRSRIDAAGPVIWLPPRIALALSMAFHELATNAVKYGALSNEHGRVAIAWQAGADRALRLVWTESGGPPVVPPPHRGFGSRLIERSLAHDLGGQVTLDFRPEGLVCTIAATIPTAEEDLATAA